MVCATCNWCCLFNAADRTQTSTGFHQQSYEPCRIACDINVLLLCLAREDVKNCPFVAMLYMGFAAEKQGTNRRANGRLPKGAGEPSPTGAR